MICFRFIIILLLLNCISCSTVDKSLNFQVPLEKVEKSSFPTFGQLPGSIFKPNFKLRISYDKFGNLQLAPGDYIIPVMTYCMQSSGSSPDGHIYTLSQMQGRRARMLRDLNMRAPPLFSHENIQILSWSLQNGLKYQELTKDSQIIVDTVLAEYKTELQESFLEKLEAYWGNLLKKRTDLIPGFNEIYDKISEIRSFRDDLLKVGNDYGYLSQRISISKRQPNAKAEQWNQISPNVYARFITDGHFLQLGQIQIRVFQPDRVPNSDLSTVTVDLLSLLANPNDTNVQPLSFAPVYGFGGVAIIPSLADAPLLALAVVGAILAAEAIDWDAFHKLTQILKNTNDENLKKILTEGARIFQERHDQLEKPAKDLGIIDKKTKNTSTDRNNDVREYTKSGGQEALDKDFDKFKVPSVKKDGVEVKELNDKVKIVKRPAKDEQLPTLEIQPQKTNNKYEDSTRIKIRYNNL